MPTVLILHGVYGDPTENWFSWLKEQLEAKGYNVVVPYFETTEPLVFEAWWKVFEQVADQLEEDSIIVGHSLGAAFALSVLEKYSAGAAFYIASAWGKTDNEFTAVMHPVADRPFDWEAIRSHCSYFEVWHSDNDPYLPVERGETLAKNLGVDMHLVPGAGHMNASAGYTEFPELLEAVVALN